VVEVSLQGGPIGNDSDLTFDRDGNLSITITVKGKNYGKSIAQDIRPYAKIFVTRIGDPFLEVPKWQSEFCGQEKILTLGPGNKTPFFKSFDKFPDETYETGIGITVPKEEVLKESSFYQDDPLRQRYINRLYLVGCVYYSSSFEKSRHQTQFVYDLIKKDKPVSLRSDLRQMQGFMQFQVGVNVPKDGIWLSPSLEGQSKAN
jgi:hypothetical protein